MPIVIKRLIEYVNQQLEFGQNEFSFNFIGFITSFITKKLDSYEIIKILQRGLEDKCIDSNMYKVLVFGTMLSPVYIQAGMIDQNALIDTLRKIQKISEEKSKKEALKIKAAKYTEILDNDTETKEFPLMEHLKKLESEGDEASLKEIINYLVKVQFSYKQVRDFFKQLRLKIPDALIGSHFILTSMDVIKKTKWAIDSSKECYVVLGNMGAGKSTFIHYLQNNVEAHKVKCSETWSLKQKIFKNPYIHTQFINSETIIPWNYEIELNKENVYIYDTPGFNITDSYEQEIVSSLALKDALEKIRILKVIPVISFDDFTPPATNFLKFLEGLSKVLKGSKPSIYIINKACLSEKPKIKTILARLAKEIPEHRETINDIKEKFEIFPKQKDHKPQNLK